MFHIQIDLNYLTHLRLYLYMKRLTCLFAQVLKSLGQRVSSSLPQTLLFYRPYVSPTRFMMSYNALTSSILVFPDLESIIDVYTCGMTLGTPASKATRTICSKLLTS